MKKNCKPRPSANLSKTFIEILKIEAKISLIILIFLAVASLYCTAFNEGNYAMAVSNSQQTKTEYQEIINLTNEARQKYGLPELKYNPQLAQIADSRISDMKNKHYFAHINPDNKGLKYFVEQADYNYLIVGENLAINYYDSQEVVQAWLESPSHRENILKPTFNEIGLSSDEIKINGNKNFVIAMILGAKK